MFERPPPAAVQTLCFMRIEWLKFDDYVPARITKKSLGFVPFLRMADLDYLDEFHLWSWNYTSRNNSNASDSESEDNDTCELDRNSMDASADKKTNHNPYTNPNQVETSANWPLLWSRIFVFSEGSESAEAAELFKCTFF